MDTLAPVCHSCLDEIVKKASRKPNLNAQASKSYTFSSYQFKPFSVSNANIDLCRSLFLASCAAQSLFYYFSVLYVLFTIEKETALL